MENKRIDPARMINYTMVFQGTSGTGKTTFAKQVVKLIAPYIPFFYIFNNSAAFNDDFAFLPGAVQGEFNMEKINSIMPIQSERTKVYEEINSLSYLFNLYGKLYGREKGEKLESNFHVKEKVSKKTHEREVSREGLSVSDRNEANFMFKKNKQKRSDRMLEKLKKVIGSEKSMKLASRRLKGSDLKKYKMRDFVPHICVIFDDCTDAFKNFSRSTKNDPFMAWATRSRHVNITTIITIHGVSILPGSLKENAHRNMFMSENIANTFLSKSVGKATFPNTKDRKGYAEDIKELFNDNSKFDRKCAVLESVDGKTVSYSTQVELVNLEKKEICTPILLKILGE